MLGLFKGLFGSKEKNKAVEMAFEACLIDEMEQETAQATDAFYETTAQDAHEAEFLKAENSFSNHMNTIHEVSCELEKRANVKASLGVEGLLPAFYTCMLHDFVRRVSCPKEEMFNMLTKLLERCPANLQMSGQEVFSHIEVNDDAGQLILAMKAFPMIVLDLAHKTGRKADGDRFLNAFAEALVAAGDICNCSYPSKGFPEAARKTGIDWMDQLNGQING